MIFALRGCQQRLISGRHSVVRRQGVFMGSFQAVIPLHNLQKTSQESKSVVWSGGSVATEEAPQGRWDIAITKLVLMLELE